MTDRLAQDTAMGTVNLLVRDLDAMIRYYATGIGLDVLEHTGPTAVLGRGSTPIMRMRAERDLPTFSRRDAGLFHTAILFADRASLAQALVSVAQFAPASFTGSADHLVSEAFYFDDPEGNGVELYVDRPREQWARTAGGGVQMDSLPLDPNAFVRAHLAPATQAAPASPSGQTNVPDAVIGHVHLQVGDIATARAFYVDTLGFEVMAAFGRQALFIAAGGYHHHIGMNTWNSAGAGPRAATLGLGQVSIEVPTTDDVVALTDRLRLAGVKGRHDGATVRFEDPWNTLIEVSAAA
ncbi:VOC family protein [Ruania halotolerans]|uniref:VOC family protein n=1 Tax=Ruania halotolerans TaxID=2897773 RepID=UPI001E5AC071|nr:VOC family protein [Ruania halotolerans]UFU06166.1 VOC family protein [Ruania halotolerans]